VETIGIDIGGTTIGVCRATGVGRPDPASVMTFANRGRDQAIAGILDAVARLEPGAEPTFGIACGGPLDAKAGLILSPPNLPEWDRVPIGRLLTEAFGGRAHLMNDANASTLAEWRFGAAQGAQHAAFLTCGTGLGAGLILDGRLYQGASGDAGEIGHVKLTDHGPTGYGVVGSCEGWCSGAGIARYAQSLIRAGKGPSITPAEGVTARWVIDAAKRGDAFAVRVLHEVGTMLGRALAVLADVVNPQVIVLGSNYVRAGALLADPTRRAFEEHALPGVAAACRIVPAALGEQLGHVASLCAAWHAEPAPPTPGPASNPLRADRGGEVTRHFDEVVLRHPLLATCRDGVLGAFDLLTQTFDRGGQVLVCGNGGSAADAEHIAGELIKGFELPRRITADYGLPDGLDARLQRGLPVIPLTGFAALRSAVANDTDPRLEFAQLVQALGRPGDGLLCLSTSGNAVNVRLAAQVAKAKNMRVVALTGRDGGALAPLADVAIRVPATGARPVQEVHLPVYHTLCLMLETAYFGGCSA